ncbi:hypothetical protein ES702_06282 [subsurface metagenome]
MVLIGVSTGGLSSGSVSPGSRASSSMIHSERRTSGTVGRNLRDGYVSFFRPTKQEVLACLEAQIDSCLGESVEDSSSGGDGNDD